MAKITKAQFRILQKKLLRDSYIAKELGVSRQAVYQMRMKFGLKSLVPDHRARNAAIVKAYKAGETGLAIAGKFDISASQVYRVINATLYKPAPVKKTVAVKKKAAAPKKAPAKKPAAAKKKAPAKKKSAR